MSGRELAFTKFTPEAATPNLSNPSASEANRGHGGQRAKSRQSRNPGAVRCRTRLNFRHPHLVRGLWHVVVYMFVARGSGSPRAVSPFPVPCHAIHCQRELKGDHAADDAATDEKMASLFGQMGCPDKWEIYLYPAHNGSPRRTDLAANGY